MAESKRDGDNRERKFSEKQYEMLLRCSQKKDVTEWNEWRKAHPDEDVFLEGADLRKACLKGANLQKGCLQGANLRNTCLEGANLREACLEGAEVCWAHLENSDFGHADLQRSLMNFAHIEGGKFAHSDLRSAQLPFCAVDGRTMFLDCRIDRHTWFDGVGLGSLRLRSKIKQLLEYNIRRKNWRDCYRGYGGEETWWLDPRRKTWMRRICAIPRLVVTSPVRLFWSFSDYGISTWRIIGWFFGFAFGFALVYWFWPGCVLVNGVAGDIRGFVHALYFSVVTMTTLGFGDIAANPDSWGGQVVLMLQVILGYVLLGALVTRFAVLFTAGGPAGKFSKEK